MTAIYASDKNYAALTAISAVSLLKHNPGAKIVLLGYNLESDAQELVRSRVKKAGGVFEYKDVSSAISELKAKGYITISGKCPVSYFEQKFYGIRIDDAFLNQVS